MAILLPQLLTERGPKLSEQHRRTLREYKSKAEHYLCSCLNLHGHNSSNVYRTPGGLLFVRQWNNLQYVASAAFLLAAYSDHLTSHHLHLHCPSDSSVPPSALLALSRSQADYILGDNTNQFCYLVGFGTSFPQRVHHRAASIVSRDESAEFIGCTQGYDLWFGRQRPNPHVLVGAVVGGPDAADGFRDIRGNFMQTEACTYNTAPLVGVFARLRRLAREGNSTFE